MNNKLTEGTNLYYYNLSGCKLRDTITYVDDKFAYGKKGDKYYLKIHNKDGLEVVKQKKTAYSYGDYYHLYNDRLERIIKCLAMKEAIEKTIICTMVTDKDYDWLKKIQDILEEVENEKIS